MLGEHGRAGSSSGDYAAALDAEEAVLVNHHNDQDPQNRQMMHALDSDGGDLQGHALARGELNCDMMGLDVEAAMAQPRAASLLTAPQQTLRGSMVGLGASVASGVRGIKAGAVCMEFKRGATFDVGGAPKNILLVTCLLNTLLVATKLSLRFSEPTSRIDAQSILDALSYCVSIGRNAFLLQFIANNHMVQWQRAGFYPKWRAVVYHSLVGMQSALILELVGLTMIGCMFKMVAYKMLGSGAWDWTVLPLITTQVVNYVLLFGLVTATDNAWLKIKSICHAQQYIQILMLGDAIVLHLFYALHAEQVPGTFLDMRILALGSFIAVRMKTYAFFKFKSTEPECTFAHQVHQAVPHYVDATDADYDWDD